MKKSLHKTLRQFDLDQQVNQFLYNLAHAPVLTFFFHDDLVGEYESKEGIHMLFNSLDYLKKLLYKVIYLLLFSSLFENWEGFLFFFVLMTLIGCLLKKVNKLDERDFHAIMLLKMESRQYVLYNIHYYLITETIGMGLALLIPCKMIGLDLLEAGLMLPTYLSMHLIKEAVFFWYVKKMGCKLPEKDKLKIASMIMLVVVAAGAYGLKYKGIYISNLDMMGWMIVICLAGVAAYGYLYYYPYYQRVHKYNLDLEFIHQIEEINNSTLDEIGSKEDNKHLDTEIQVQDKTGYDYLYSTFIARYKIGKKKSRWIIYIILIAIGIFINTVPLWLGETMGYADNIFSSMSLLIYGMFFLTSGSKSLLTNSFFQIDRYLIHYKFYRQPDAILKNLKMRLKTMIQMTAIPTAIVVVSLVMVEVLYDTTLSFSRLFVAVTLPISLTAFFNMYYLGSYYLLQPYDFNGNVVNKVYKTVDYLLFVLIYILFRFDIELNIIVVSIMIVILAVVSFVLYKLVMKKAPTVFRVR